ncbi:hypothetical protein NL676_030300 [Syzygium grande]|nr:hypothetical protein NL676_030300 [Syzygium grande]
MYGSLGVDLVIQGSVFQAIVWLSSLLFALEMRRSGLDILSSSSSTEGDSQARTAVDTKAKVDLEGRMGMMVSSSRPSFGSLMRTVWRKLAMNPNSYACVVGIAWAFIANRWHIKMPSIIDGCILILSKAGTGTAMFSMGMFMALQEKLIACGPSLTVFGMVLRFIAGPVAMAIGSIALGLRGDVLRVAIIQAALPQSITSFIYAKEFGLHANVLSTAVIFGMMVSLPVLLAYFAILEFVH